MNQTTNLNHIIAIQKYIEVIVQADDMHALIVEGPPGWGKTTAVEEALKLAHLESVHLGAYSTALNLYNFLFAHQNSIVLIDDCAGLFDDKAAMAILKASTWPSLGKRRIVKWGSTSNLAHIPIFEFSGKLVIVCNSFPKTPDGAAICSRSYVRKVDVKISEAKHMLMQAAKDTKWFSKPEVSIQVAEFLINQLSENNLIHISFRTLKKGYRLAETHPSTWKELFNDAIPNALSPNELVRELARGNLKVKDQARVFKEKTGLNIRSFYYYRKGCNISYSNRSVEASRT